MTIGMLYIVATPIGNLKDITLRAIDTLQQVDLILAEDTRHSAPLLRHFNIDKPLQSFHAHNEHQKTACIIEKLQNGQNIALISDAGTPLISDPGFPLVKAARDAGISVTPIPGVSAIIAALSASGLPCERFSFEGFLPAKPKARQQRLQSLANQSHTIVCYESSHRIEASLQDIKAIFEDRELVLAKELTKSHERLISATADIILSWLKEDERRKKGEFVLIIQGVDEEVSQYDLQQVLVILLETLPVKQAAVMAAKICDCSKNQAYQLALSLKVIK